jgi:type IV secretory pathway component VirB8
MKDNINIPAVITSMYEDESYFKEAREWYYLKYLSQYRSRSVFILLSAGISIVTIFILVVLTKQAVNHRNVSGVITNAIDPSQPLKIVKIQKYYNNTDESISRFLIEYFIKNIEGFSYVDGKSELDKKNKTLAQSFNGEISQVIQSRFNSVYIPSYINGYSRVIDIMEFDFIQSKMGVVEKIKSIVLPSGLPGKAIVYFRARHIYQPQKKLIATEYFKADISFAFRPIKKLNDKMSSIKFFITSYNVTKVKLTDDEQ